MAAWIRYMHMAGMVRLVCNVAVLVNILPLVLLLQLGASLGASWERI